jgi:opacity protein-like surface antigen
MRRLIALFVIFACTPALAQDDRGPYVGLGIAQVTHDNNFMIWFDVSETATAPRLVAGFRFNEKLAFEAVYADSADFSASLSGSAPNFLDSNSNVAGGNYTAKYTGSLETAEIRVLAHAGYWVFGAGLFWSDLTDRLIGSTAPPPLPEFSNDFEGRHIDSDTGYALIIGAQFDIGNWGIRPEYEYYDVSGPSDVSSFAANFTYRF